MQTMLIEPGNMLTGDQRDATTEVGEVEMTEPLNGSLHGGVATGPVSQAEATGDLEKIEVEGGRPVESVGQGSGQPQRRRAEYGEPEPFDVGRAEVMAKFCGDVVDPRFDAKDNSRTRD